MDGDRARGVAHKGEEAVDAAEVVGVLGVKGEVLHRNAVRGFMSWPAESVIWFPDLNFRSNVLINSNIAFRLIGMKLVLFVIMLSRL